MMETNPKKTIRHDVVMINRKKLDITGVLKVESFDHEEFLLHTEAGFLTIKGKNLHMKNLSLETGQVSIEGLVFAMEYIDESYQGEKAKGIFGRIFK
ncbi:MULTISPECIES: sporulation protein YabP [Aneurinibacillus]|jgi:sporulation protein YabP|uniref:Sporulation protein YabP n=4 Tax=Aneurinibacillus TaxID=55079 RepID=A0A0K2W9F5_ANEMI|nr:sporulation protein YabP [Aneurinibacillus aneurinilyticus ATCC 12856]GED15375.1 sporulation protein YabP [Aneurinibacillus migulanus]CEH27798.1 Sporulation protein YabP [Aneurinibacillus migulanus]SDK06140.1 sporulation protein YabP [Aneurinibacillus migulanus]